MCSKKALQSFETEKERSLKRFRRVQAKERKAKTGDYSSLCREKCKGLVAGAEDQRSSERSGANEVRRCLGRLGLGGHART